MNDIAAIIAILFSIGMSAVSLYLAIRKAPFDIRKLNGEASNEMADVAKKYQELASDAADNNIKLHLEIQSVREKLEAVQSRHEKELDEIRVALATAETRAAKFEDWAKRLVAQIESLGEKPVPFELKPRNPTQPRKDK